MINYKYLWLVSISLSGLLNLNAQQPYQKTTKKTSPSDKTLLWKVSGMNLPQPSYLFGTMHILCSDDAQVSEGLQQAIGESDRVVFEIDLDDSQEMMGAIRYLRMNDGMKLSDLLSAAEYERVKQYLQENSFPIPLVMMNRFKPYFISSLVGEKMMNCEKTNGMEQQIMAVAQEKDKEIFGLETIEFQSSIFDSIPYEKQARDLLQYIDSIDSYRKVTQEMLEIYRLQDLERMEQLILKSDPGMEQYMDLMLYNRNKKWISSMQSHMLEKPTLFAVGAGHLPGEQGVIELLRKKGYKVNPVKN